LWKMVRILMPMASQHCSLIFIEEG
jgi:hypothetical protein